MIDLRSSEQYEFALNCMLVTISVEVAIMFPAILVGVNSILNETQFFTWSSLMKIIIVDVLHIAAVYFSEYALNISRWLLFYPWIKYLGLFFSQWETFVWHDERCPLFYVDVNGYTTLTEYFNHHLAQAKLTKDDGPDERAYFKFAKKSKRNIMSSTPSSTKRLFDNNCLEIRTKPCTYLTHEHFRIAVNHTVATEILYEGGTASNSWEMLTPQIFSVVQLCADVGVMDEFWVNGKLVAFQTSVVMGEVLIDGTWAVLPEARKLGLYFEGIRMVMKRAIADPSVKYLNLHVMDLEKENLCLPKRKLFAREFVSKSEEDFTFCSQLCGFPDYFVSSKNLGLWLDMFGSIRLGKKFWNVKDRSDLY